MILISGYSFFLTCIFVGFSYGETSTTTLLQLRESVQFSYSASNWFLDCIRGTSPPSVAFKSFVDVQSKLDFLRLHHPGSLGSADGAVRVTFRSIEPVSSPFYCLLLNFHTTLLHVSAMWKCRCFFPYGRGCLAFNLVIGQQWRWFLPTACMHGIMAVGLFVFPLEWISRTRLRTLSSTWVYASGQSSQWPVTAYLTPSQTYIISALQPSSKEFVKSIRARQIYCNNW